MTKNRRKNVDELNPNDSITRTRGVAYPARVCIPAVEVDIFYPSSCKPIVVAPHPPDSGNFFAHIVHTARVRSPLTTDDVVPLGTAVGPPGAARIKTRVRTPLYARLGEGPSWTTNERRLSQKK